MTASQVSDAVREHLERQWPDRSHEVFVWNLGPTRERFPRFRVRRFARRRRNQAWVYATVGAWEATPENEPAMEFFLEAPREDSRHVELLAMVTNFHADERYRLQVGKTINIGRPWMDGARAEHLLVSLPYPYGPALERCRVGELDVRILWLLPITGEEAAYARQHGHDALEQRFEAQRINWLDPHRKSVA